MQKVILITWPNGSWKWTVAEYLHEKYGAILYRFSSPLYTILSDMWLPCTRENLDILSRSLRENFGQDIMWRGVREFIESHPDELIVLDGIRRASAMQEFSELIDMTLWIDASLDTRYIRVSSRWEKDGELWISREKFESQESLESEKSLSLFRDLSDLIIDNNSTEEELYKKIDTFLATLY